MLEMIISLFIIGFSATIGYLIAKGYENRIRHIQDLIVSLKVLESEMFYRMDPLPKLLHTISLKTSGMVGCFFVQVCNGLEKQYSYDFYGSWIDAVEITYHDSSLTKEDMEILGEIGISLGKTDLTNQRSFFQQAYKRLEQQLTEAMSVRQVKGKLYQTMTTALGVMVVILLL